MNHLMLPKKARQAIYGIVLAGLCMADARAQTEPDFPVRTGQVVDAASLLSESTKVILGNRINRLRSDTGVHLVVVSVTSLQGYDIADYGTLLGNYWGIGDAGEDNGILLIVAPNERRVRIAVGYGLEDNLTESICNDIIQNEILPQMRNDRYAAGIVDGTSAITAALKGAYKPSARADADTTSSFHVGLYGIIIMGVVICVGAWACRSKGPDPNHHVGPGDRGLSASRDLLRTGSGFSNSGFSGSGSLGSGSPGGGSFGGGGASGGW